MTDVVFVVPGDGSEVVAPDDTWLRRMVLRRGANFWSSGSGQGWLKHSKGMQLLLTFGPRLGFYLEYIDLRRRYWIPFFPDAPEGKIAVWVGGDPIIVSKRFFVPRVLAWVAVEEFCATGRRTSQIEWVRRNDIDWSFGYWDHPEVKVR